MLSPSLPLPIGKKVLNARRHDVDVEEKVASTPHVFPHSAQRSYPAVGSGVRGAP